MRPTGVAWGDWVRMGHEERNSVTGGAWTMKIVKEDKGRGCRASRCAAPGVAVAVGLGDYGNVRLCSRHLPEAADHAESIVFDSEPTALAPSEREASGSEAADRASALAAGWLESLEGFEVRGQEDLELLAEVISEARAAWSSVEAERVRITKPLDEAKRAAQRLFKPALDALASVEVAAKFIVAAHVQAEAERNRAAMDRVDLSAMTATREVEGLSTRRVRAFEVVDPDAVPRELCSPDPAKIRQAMAQLTDAEVDLQAFPGIRLFFQTQVVSR